MPRGTAIETPCGWPYHLPVRPPSLGVALAHPLTEPFQLPLSPLAAATAGGALVFIVAMAVPRSRPSSPRQDDRPLASWTGELSSAQVATRVVAVGLLGLAVAAGRLGADRELDNLAPALVIGFLWPALVLASFLAGPVWRWADPWDGLARALRAARAAEPGHVWPALLPALAWAWFVSAYPDTLDPRAVGAVLALYTLFTVAGALAVGRARWLSAAEPFGILLAWLARFPRRRVGVWEPPRGSEALLGVFAGGILFGAVRRSELWGGLNTSEHADVWAALGVILFSAGAAGLLVLLGLTLQTFAARSVAAQIALPMVAGIVVAVAMERNRLTTSAQLLPQLFGDPFGRGWELLGGWDVGLDAAPLGEEGLLWAQLAVLLGGFFAGAIVLGRRLDRGDRPPAALLLAVLASAAVIAVITH
jgi:hypothetical protein